MVLRRIYGSERNAVTGECMKLHNEKLHNLYSYPNYIRQIKSRRMRLAGHVARMERREKRTRFWCEGPKEEDHSENRGVMGGWDHNGS
jgi:hypothetical protein